MTSVPAMKFNCQILFIFVCIGIICFVFLEFNTTAESKAHMPASLVASQESADSQANDILLEHESNGPEGASGIPMQRMSPTEIGLALGILFLGTGLAAIQGKPEKSSPPCPRAK